MTLSSPVAAQDYDKGLAAYDADDFAAALKEFTPLAEAGNAYAQSNLGVMYFKGNGVPKDYAEAVKWWRLAADQGDAYAQYRLGGMYARGRGVLQDYAEAMKWYRLAAEQGHTNAQSFLGTMYKYGKGVPQDNIMAHMWYNIGAANGHELGGANRDKIAKTMTPAAIEKAKAMAGVCLSSNYKKCGY